MPDEPTVHTQEEALRVLLEHQARTPGAQTQPAWEDTIETDAGWAFFNVNGYLGTVTELGEVVVEEQFVKDE